jgi:coatomer protein complex subunit epsilon
VSILAEYFSSSSNKPEKVEEIRDLVLELEGNEEDGDVKMEEGVVRVVAGTLFVLEGEVEEAVATLTEGAAKIDLEW